MRIGIFGGSFDPVHKGHLALASFAQRELNLNRIVFVPSSQNPLKKNKCLFSNSARMAMLRKSIRRFSDFSVSDHELRRSGPSYTVETLKHFKKKFSPKTQLYFLAGSDTPRHFSRWKSPDKVLKLCRFVVMTRPGSKMHINDGRFLWLPMPPVSSSASDIRRRIKSKLRKK